MHEGRDAILQPDDRIFEGSDTDDLMQQTFAQIHDSSQKISNI